MKTIEFSTSERLGGLAALLLYPLFFAIFIPYEGIEYSIKFRFTAVFSLFFLYSFFRNLFLLWREHPLSDVFKVDTQCIEKTSANGIIQRAAWSDLQAFTSVSIRSSWNLRHLLRHYLVGKRPMKLIFADGTVISISRLFWLSIAIQLFGKVFRGIAVHGPLGNPLLVEMHEADLYVKAVKKKSAEHALIRWCVLSQLFALAWIVFSHVAYFWMGLTMKNYLFFNCTGAILSPCLLVVVYVYFHISGRPGLFLVNRRSISDEHND